MEMIWHKLDKTEDLPARSDDYLTVVKYQFYREEEPIKRREIVHYSRENGWGTVKYSNRCICSAQIMYWSDILPFPEEEDE